MYLTCMHPLSLRLLHVLRAPLSGHKGGGDRGSPFLNAVFQRRWRWNPSYAGTDITGSASRPADTFSLLLKTHTPGPALISLEETPFAGSSVVASEGFEAGKTLLKIPLALCILVDYRDDGGRVNLPDAEWPRLRKGLDSKEDLAWDLIQALALLDGLAGNADDFWNMYAKEMLPDPLTMSLPVCLPPKLLDRLEDEKIVQAAWQQKKRLESLFPGLARPMCEDGPSWMEWSFACVRSRAFAVAPDVFGYVPFLDVVNHSQDPNADFRLSSDQETVELVALTQVDAESHLFISYSGVEFFDNRRFMQQYGFVPRQGNFADRLVLPCIDEGLVTTKLSLEALQAALGDGDEMVAAFSGKNLFAYAALKSLPLELHESSNDAPLTEQMEAAKKMLQSVRRMQSTWKTTLEEDESELLHLERHARHGAVDRRLEAVVRYNVHRKRVAQAMERILAAFAE